MTGTEPAATEMHPDKIVHIIATAEGESVRVFLDGPIRVPLEPITERGGTKTAEVDPGFFDAKITFADIADAGETLTAHFLVPQNEWEKLRLHEHWEKEAAEDWRGERIIECWGTRGNNYGDYEPDEYESPVPSDSPTVVPIEESRFEIDTPPAPFDPPTLNFDAVTAESVTDYRNAWTQQKLGTVQAVVPLEESLDPTRRDKDDPRDFDRSPPPRPDRPDIDFEELAPLTPSEDLLEAVFTINRHAKRLDNEADEKYAQGQGAEARAASVRKAALYAAKTVAIHRFLRAEDTDVDITKHSLNGEIEMFLFDFGDYSFHQPLDAIADDVFDAIDSLDKDQSATEIEFSPSADTESLSLSLKEAVGRLAAADIDPNDYLRTERVEDYDWGYYVNTEFDHS